MRSEMSQTEGRVNAEREAERELKKTVCERKRG